jgi:hypothetical protein
VRDLASLFRTRIELKQIGVRDEAKRLRRHPAAAVGSVPAPRRLPELRPVTPGRQGPAAVAQSFADLGSVRPADVLPALRARILRQSRKRFPKEGKIVATALGEAKVGHIPRAHHPPRDVEGDLRTLPLADFKSETEQVAGPAATVAAIEEEEAVEGIRPRRNLSRAVVRRSTRFRPARTICPPPTEMKRNGNGRRQRAEHEAQRADGKTRRSTWPQ